jgi:hypothetical protein
MRTLRLWERLRKDKILIKVAHKSVKFLMIHFSKLVQWSMYGK